MFSLTEIEDGKFIYRCHECGLDSEIMTTEQADAYLDRTSARRKP